MSDTGRCGLLFIFIVIAIIGGAWGSFGTAGEAKVGDGLASAGAGLTALSLGWWIVFVPADPDEGWTGEHRRLVGLVAGLSIFLVGLWISLGLTVNPEVTTGAVLPAILLGSVALVIYMLAHSTSQDAAEQIGADVMNAIARGVTGGPLISVGLGLMMLPFRLSILAWWKWLLLHLGP